MAALFQREKTINRVVLLSVEEIVPNPAQPRRDFNPQELQELAASIRENGLLQPITVRKNQNHQYELISGERRWRSAGLAGLREIPAVILETTPRQSAIYAILENIQRKDLTFFEEAMALRSLINEWGVTQEEAAEKLGRAQSTIANKLRLLMFDNAEQKMILEHGLTERHARALLRIKEEQERRAALETIIQNQWNVRQSERYIERLLKLTPAPTGRRVLLLKDVRVFVNTINRAIDVMKHAGIDAEATKTEDEQYIEYHVRIPKRV